MLHALLIFAGTTRRFNFGRMCRVHAGASTDRHHDRDAAGNHLRRSRFHGVCRAGAILDHYHNEQFGDGLVTAVDTIHHDHGSPRLLIVRPAVWT
jgi:hypothetical protein